jgi:hypothetical protein
LDGPAGQIVGVVLRTHGDEAAAGEIEQYHIFLRQLLAQFAAERSAFDLMAARISTRVSCSIAKPKGAGEAILMAATSTQQKLLEQ